MRNTTAQFGVLKKLFIITIGFTQLGSDHVAYCYRIAHHHCVLSYTLIYDRIRKEEKNNYYAIISYANSQPMFCYATTKKS